MSECNQVEPLLAIHAVEETDVGEALRVEEHVAACEACGSELEAYRTIRVTVGRDLRDVPPLPALKLPVRAGLEARVRVWAPRLVAAALLLAAGLILGRWSAPETTARPVQAGASVATAAMDAAPALARRSVRALSVFSPVARGYLEKAAKAGPSAGESPRPETAP